MAIVKALLFTVFISLSLAATGKWWEEQQYTEWSASQVETILNNSAWVGLVGASPAKRLGLSVAVPSYYQIRILTARPVREGFLRMLSLGMPREVGGTEESHPDVTENYKKLLQEFLRSQASDAMLGTGERPIILAVTLKRAFFESRDSVLRDMTAPPLYREVAGADQLSDLDFSRVTAETSLGTSSGKKVAILSFVPPGPDRLGAKLYFARALPDGTPLIAAKDKELVFETCLNGSRIKTKFDLKRMAYKGKLEF